MTATRDDVQRLVQRVVLYAWVGNKEEVLYRVKREMTDVPACKFDGATRHSATGRISQGTT